MKRPQILVLTRLFVLVAGLTAAQIFIVAPLWKNAAAESRREADLATDFRRVQSGWDQLTADLRRRHPESGPARSMDDNTAARILAAEPAPPSGGLDRLVDVMPQFLAGTARLADEYDITWTAIRAGRPEATAVSLAGNETMPLSRVRVHLSAEGAYPSVGRALKELLAGDATVVIRDVSILAGHNGEVRAELEVDLYGAP